MRKKFETVIVVIIIFLSTIIISFNLDLGANSQGDEKTPTSPSRSNNLPRAGNFDWGEIEVISEPIVGMDFNIGNSESPRIAVENDKIYIVWQDQTNYNNAGIDRDIFYRYFDGNQWSNIQVISEPVSGQNLNIADSYSPDIVVNNGKIFVVWYDYNNTNSAGSDSDIFYRCNLTGFNWEDIQVISEPISGQNFNTDVTRFPDIAVDNGKIFVVWEDYNDTNNAGSDGDISYRCNITGINWENIQVISEPVQGQNFNTGDSELPAIAVENDRIYVTWLDTNDTNGAANDYDTFYRSNITSTRWEDVQVISEPIQGWNLNVGGSSRPSIAVESNKIYVVWGDYNNTNNASSDWDIFYRCNLTGSFWEPMQIISEPISGQNSNIKISISPKITVKNSKIFITWADENNTNNAGTDRDIFYRCNITGANWEDIEIISEPIKGSNFNTGISTCPDIVINSGKNYIVWCDTNNTNNAGFDTDIFYLTISSSVILGFPSVTPTSGNTSTKFNFTLTYYHLNNKPPTEITVNISGTEYSMLEVDHADKNYTNGKNFYFTIKNLNIGMHIHKFRASDSSILINTRYFTKPYVYNTNPNITTKNNLIAYEDINYKVNYNYEDIDFSNIGQNAYWNCSTNANWLEFNTKTAILNGTPTNDDVGKYWINVSINDTMDSDFTNFTLTVINVNDAPIITTDDIEIINEDELYEVDYKAVDVDSPQDILFWNLQTNASWLNFEQSTAKLNGIPENNDVGEYWVNITVNDTEYEDFSNFTLQVVNVNDPPKIITKDNTTAFEDEFYKMSYKAEDVDNTQNELFWDIKTNAKWLDYDIPTAIINGTPTNDDIGEYWVNISVNDNQFVDFTNFTLIVINTNDPPSIITEDNTNATVGELYSINYEAEDIDPPPITLIWYLKTNTSDWLSIDPITGWVTGLPSESDADIYWVNISVTDGENGWDFHNFTLQVLKMPIQKNNAPQLFNTSISPSEGDIKTEFTFSVRYYDADGDIPVLIQVVIEGRVYTLKLKSGENAANGIYEYSTILSEGTHLYYFTAFDGSESVKTNNLTTPDIKDIDKISTQEISWYWLFLIVIVITIIVVLILMLVLKKRKAIKLPTVQAEILRAPPEHIALPSATPSVDIATPLAAQPIVLEQLPSPKVQAQPSDVIPSGTISTPSLAPTTIETQFQLPKATLSRTQKLELLEERFLRDEVTEETYKELKGKIETLIGEDITKDDSEVQLTTAVQQLETIEQSISEEVPPTNLSEVVDKPQQQLPIEPEITELSDQIQLQEKQLEKELNDKE